MRITIAIWFLPFLLSARLLFAQEVVLVPDTVFVGINEPGLISPAANDILPDGAFIINVSPFPTTGGMLITRIPDENLQTTAWSVQSQSLQQGWDSTGYRITYLLGGTEYLSDIGNIYFYNYVGPHNDTLALNNIHLTLNMQGEIGYDKYHTSNNSYCNSATSQKRIARKIDITVGGIDQYEYLNFAGHLFSQVAAYTAGPIGNFYPGRYDPFFEYWQQPFLRTWKITQSAIEYHTLHWHEPEYTIPDDILNWPGNGPVEWGVAERLAPFADRNGNGIYEPQLGDYPIIKGDEAILSICRPVPDQYLETEFKLDLITLLYVYHAPDDSLLNNTAFIHHTLINRDARFQYHDTYIGYELKFLLGNTYNDYFGTDSTLNMIYSYNSSASDYGVDGFEPFYPALGFITLNRDLFSSLRRTEDFTIVGYPNQPIEYYYNYQAFFNDGITHLTAGDDGLDQDNPLTNYMFHGYVRDPEGWSLEAMDYPYANEKATGAVYWGDFSPDTICLESALVFACDYSDTIDNLSSVDLLLERVTQLHDWYGQQYNSDCLSYRYEPYTEAAPPDDDPFTIYPNPFGDYILIELNGNLNEQDLALQMYNLHGQLVHREVLQPEYPFQTMTVQMPDLPAGMYILVLQYDDNRKAKQLIHQ